MGRNFSTKFNEISNLVKVSECMIAAHLCLFYAYVNISWLETYDILCENKKVNACDSYIKSFYSIIAYMVYRRKEELSIFVNNVTLCAIFITIHRLFFVEK